MKKWGDLCTTAFSPARRTISSTVVTPSNLMRPKTVPHTLKIYSYKSAQAQEAYCYFLEEFKTKGKLFRALLRNNKHAPYDIANHFFSSSPLQEDASTLIYGFLRTWIQGESLSLGSVRLAGCQQASMTHLFGSHTSI